ncbi:RCC1-like G exchanging factor-like protein [Eurytemora carolleeae]|uniref:RCC1-like G exchanging factor-like protein n=1 Tax=Eurytemora carolleeae TaxID=1294199 RepID=UPI000C789CAF|nr:RCC1-like G exchanging factor-like protein [Eurytemora carolleeae]|eukprot:XP_023349229.1 RCC1-like G exchanging factor-like protein [Eurytemora affinis]
MRKISCRADCVLALNDKGEVFGWGNSEYSQFRMITEEQQLHTPTHIPLGIGKVKDIASGGTICLALNEDGDVYVWGYGILGKGPNLNTAIKPEKIPPALFGISPFSPDIKITSLHAGLGHQAVVNSSGDLYIWGQNRERCLGLGEHGNQFFPLKIAIPGRVKEVSLGVDHSAVIASAWT